MAWKDTLNLPETAFPMKANLVQREPEIQARWESMDLYARVREARRGSPRFTFHDGPPYANGEVHPGTARNKVLKDITVRYRTMRGLDAPFVAGWDCHGLPIENNVMKELGGKAREMSASDIRELCRQYASKYVDVQRASYRRFGVLADWDRPYLTMSPDYEAGVLDVFGDLVEKGYVTRGLRSIHWCVTCRTALAEAEIEYAPKTSPSIFVRFPVLASDAAWLGGEGVAAVIWTTTPWTLPANVAVAVHPELDYAVVVHDGPDGARRVLVALPRVEAYLAAVGGVDHEIPQVVRGRELRGTRLSHPFLDRTVPIVLADYVSADDGTGLVHTAPGHGADDFATGKAEGLPILCPVGRDGVFTAEVEDPRLVGVHVFDADEKVLEILREREALAASTQIEHSYPHCWRCHRKLIFRATDQWFVQVDHRDLRARALKACAEEITWVPAWGAQRIAGMLRDRPDWCISRQRMWGVPIPAFYCTSCEAVLCDGAIVRHVRGIVAREGADAWFRRDAAELAPPGLACACGGRTFRKETDIFDVWFESGSSWRSVLTEANGLDYPADCYLEGHDQHRGWFQLSLLPAMASRERPPFRTCVTTGFFIDDTGAKVSKSKGGIKDLAAERIFGQIGVDIARLFFVSGNYFDDMPVSARLLEPAGEQYRKIRNTLRFVLGGLGDFAADDAVDVAHYHAIDRWAVQRMDEVATEVDAAYDGYEYHRAAAVLREFMDSDLSAFYLDLVKDRLYCADVESVDCRSVRTALARLANVLIRLWSPILVYTMEEAWDAVKAFPKLASVHLEHWPHHGSHDPARAEWVARLRRVRTEIQRKVDPLRKDGTVGSGQDVAVRYHVADPALRSALVEDVERYVGARDTEERVLEILGVAEFHRVESADGLESTDLAGLSLAVGRSELVRCERCRRRRPDVKSPAEGADPLCRRCEPWRGKEVA